MGEVRKEALRLGFDGSVRLEFRGATVSTEGGLLAYQDVDDAFALTATAAAMLNDWRTGTNIRHSLTALLRGRWYNPSRWPAVFVGQSPTGKSQIRR